ncbi:MAG: FAD-dependent oxidoreductase [Candidatus Kapabacteria bacterium]|nr:FAD-dependent oxidoreductase [Candidatus Kapabacteria bacterium]
MAFTRMFSAGGSPLPNRRLLKSSKRALMDSAPSLSTMASRSRWATTVPTPKSSRHPRERRKFLMRQNYGGTPLAQRVLSGAMTSAQSHSTSTLVLGAGYAGLTAAALLANEGHEVTVLESHDTLGGCASFYRVGKCTYDVGATTVSGVVDSQPAGRVFRHLGIVPEFIKQDPGMVIRMGERDVLRHAGVDAWIDEAERHFPGGRQGAFWQELYRLEQRVWSLVQGLTHFPPANASDVLRLAKPSLLASAPLSLGLIRPMDVLMERYGVHGNSDFRRFINEQLLISTQNTSSAAPYLTGAMGLTYPSETYYPVGGMVRPALMLMRHATSKGAQVKFRRRVTAITRQAGSWLVSCDNGETYRADRVVSSIPIWNMASLTDERVRSHFERLSHRFDFGWGAITLYIGIKGVPRLPSQYVQLHLNEPIPFVHSGSVFMTFSHPDDRQKAPEGMTTLTVSTHAMAEDWKGLSPEEYARRKSIVTEAIVNLIRRRMHELDGMEFEHIDAGTPQTWVSYTQRHDGFVGGIPHDVRRPLFMLPPNQTPFTGLYMIGDSAFPGQGMPAVMLGAWNTVARIFDA